MPKIPHDKAILAYAILSGLPATAVALLLIWRSDFDGTLQWSLSLLLLACWLGFAVAAREKVIRPLQTMANLLMALREGDYSFRARGARYDNSLGDVLVEINTLGSVLQSQRRGAVEATALLLTVMDVIDVAIFAFDPNGAVRLANRAGERLLGLPAGRLVGRSAAEVGLAECLAGDPSQILPAAMFPGTHGRWGLRRTRFREGGLPHELIVIADLSQPLREEELKAWQGLVRVLGHELNNSLAPIKSIAGSLGDALRRGTRPADFEEDLRSGLDIIASRAEALAGFLQAYSRLARLPAPVMAYCKLEDLARRIVALETRLAVDFRGGPPVDLNCDPAQVEQALINLVRNAADAAMEERAAGRSRAGVRLGWSRIDALVEIRIEDDGPGLAQTSNLFVPFFTTKPEGSGIGLVLCRQIAENHRGSLELANRTDGSGCIAKLRLPLG